MSANRMTKAAIAAAALALLSACGGSGSNDKETTTSAVLNYYPLAGFVPSPNDLAFQDSTDGTLNATPAVPASTGEPADASVSVNSLDGFSTIAGGTASFSAPVDGTTITPGTTVRVFQVSTQGDPNTATMSDPAGPKPVSGIVRELSGSNDPTVAAEYSATLSPTDPNGTTLAITPRAPLASDTTYMVVVTSGIQEQGGGAIGASVQYQLAKSPAPLVDMSGVSQVSGLTDSQAQTLEGVRQLVGGVDVTADSVPDIGQIPAIEGGTSLTANDVIASWTFTTQTIGDSLDQARAAIQGPASAPQFNVNPTPVGPTPAGGGTSHGDIYVGTLSGMPYYLEPGDADPTKVRTGFWAQSDGSMLAPANNTPSVKVDLEIPVMITMPQTDGGTASPVVIFQHGITADRTAVLGIANALSQAGFVVVSIDLPLHGITDTTNPLYAGDLERTFNVDLVDNVTGAAGPDGEIDPSGEHFINLESLRTTRDNVRQGIADLFAVTRAIRSAANSGVDLDGDMDADFTTNISFVGHSLGGIVGTGFLAKEPSVGAAVLGMAGGGVAKLVDGSPSIGPKIQAGLEANGFVKGSTAYEQFLGAAQTVIDSGDPLNYATGAADGRNLLMLEVVGGSSSPADQVVPNNVFPPYQQGIPSGTVPSPTAGTDPLWGTVQAFDVATTVNTGQIDSDPAAAGDYLIRYTAGDHASLLSPAASTPATGEMQQNVASFLLSGGTSITFTGSGTVDPVSP